MDTQPLSITDFLTDGSLAALCQAIAEITRSRIGLHDEQGRRIIHTGKNPPWTVGRMGDPARRIAHALQVGSGSASVIEGDGRHIHPLKVANRVIGAIVVDADPAALSAEEIDRLYLAVTFITLAVDELFAQDVEIAQRNTEIETLFRLSSVLVEARDLEDTLRVALHSALEVFDVDAGLIHLSDDDSSELKLQSHIGLSPHAAECFGPLIAANSDADPSPALRDAAAHEGFQGVLAGELSFRGRSLGRITLCSRRPAQVQGSSRALFRSMNEQISAAVASARMLQDQRAAREVDRQLRLAAQVQRRMLPRAIPTIPGLDLAARCVPSFGLGGDFYDFIELERGRLALVVGDVVGKGIPAALLMASVRATLRAYADEAPTLDVLMERANRATVRDTMPNEFVTVFYSVIDPHARTLTHCSAGHDPTFIIRAPRQDSSDTPALIELTSGGTIIGVDEHAHFDTGAFALEPGDTIVAYTDGVIDARNFESQRFGRDRFKRTAIQFLCDNPECSANDLVEHIVWEVRRFVGLNPAADDLTIVVARFHPDRSNP